MEAIDLVGLFTEQRGWWRQSLETCHAGPAAFTSWIGPNLGGVSGGFRTNQGRSGARMLPGILMAVFSIAPATSKQGVCNSLCVASPLC